MIPRLRLKPKEDRRVARGHCWVYRNELAETPDAPDGAVVDVLSAENRFVGRGFFQAHGGIAVRILSRRQRPIDAAFLAGRVADALRFRERLFPSETTYRWIFGESDGIPGLVADRYAGVVVAQTACAFYASYLDDLAAAFQAQPGVHGARIEIGNDVHAFGDAPTRVECVIDGVRVRVDLGGQKTGLFLDQRLNCRVARRYAAGARVLDGHCYVGLWSVHACLGGARCVTGIDTSGQAVEAARENAALNGVADRCTFDRGDVAAALERAANFDLVILDPPAFARSHAQERKALASYLALNRAAMKAVAPGGVLITSSCSHFVDEAAFLETLKRAAAAAQRRAWILEVHGAAPDHPVLMAMPETGYLKCVALRIL